MLKYATPKKLKVRPRTITLCGSTRFMEQFREADAMLTSQGIITTGVALVATQCGTDVQHVDPDLKAQLDELHFRKIDWTDGVYIVNVGGYVGYSTDREVRYAYSQGKQIDSLEPVSWNWCPSCSTMGVLNSQEHYCDAKEEVA